MNHYVYVYEERIATFDILAITKLNSVINANGELTVERIFLDTFGHIRVYIYIYIYIYPYT